MAKSLAEYYTFNYTKCEFEDSFLASWQGFLYSYRAIMCIALPIELFTFHVIWNKSPGKIIPVRWPLLLFNFFCTFQDFQFNTLTIPYIFLPSFGYLGLGTFSSLEVYAPYQIFIIYSSILCTGSSMIYLFESRSSGIPENKYKITEPRSKFLFYTINLMVPCAICVFIFDHVPEDQEAAKLEALMVVPCPIREFFMPNVYVLLDSFWTNMFMAIVIPLLVSSVMSQILFFIVCSFYYLYLAPSLLTSSQTRSNQKHFFIGTLKQTGVALSVMILAFSIATLTFKSKQSTQELTNLYFIIFGFHGIVQSITVLMVHQPYRQLLREMIRCGNAKVETRCFVQTIQRV